MHLLTPFKCYKKSLNVFFFNFEESLGDSYIVTRGQTQFLIGIVTQFSISLMKITNFSWNSAELFFFQILWYMVKFYKTIYKTML